MRLLRSESNQRIELARIEITPGRPGQLHESFRYFPLSKPVTLHENTDYALLMSTIAADGDHFHDPAPFDGLSPLTHPDLHVQRSILVRPGMAEQSVGIPAFEDLSDSHLRYRAPVGPTLMFRR